MPLVDPRRIAENGSKPVHLSIALPSSIPYDQRRLHVTITPDSFIVLDEKYRHIQTAPTGSLVFGFKVYTLDGKGNPVATADQPFMLNEKEIVEILILDVKTQFEKILDVYPLRGKYTKMICSLKFTKNEIEAIHGALPLLDAIHRRVAAKMSVSDLLQQLIHHKAWSLMENRLREIVLDWLIRPSQDQAGLQSNDTFPSFLKRIENIFASGTFVLLRI